ncbi:MAG: MBL fold metallo-hydrolase [Phycisphaerae bacterium]|nr:MBL fold metallo-hydrolase [Phycisphaerae bacterium]
MQLIFLGTGTSQGIPMIGCQCAVCRSRDPHDRRMRASAAVRLAGGQTLLIDTSPELRVCALAAGLERVDAVLYTHSHADHVMGLDDLRSYNQRQDAILPCFGDARTVAMLRRAFGYAEVPPGGQRPPDRPGVTFHEITGPFELFGQTIMPVPLLHASTGSLGYRIGRLAYCTDCSGIPDSSFELLSGLDTLVLGMLRRRPHPAHMSLDQALAAADRIGARRTFFIHMSHDMPHEATNRQLPPNRQLAYDGQVVEIADADG